jgi:hypothetical protein
MGEGNDQKTLTDISQKTPKFRKSYHRSTTKRTAPHP